MIKIITAFDLIAPYLKDVQKLADSHKNQLGFIPYSAYKDFAVKGNLLVATLADQQEKPLFAGYVVLGGRFPTRRIFQLAVVSQCRGHGIGKALVDAVVQDTEKNNFYQISINVGTKLPANIFWEKLQFSVATQIKGKLLHPIQNVRIREIVPSLFSTASDVQQDLQSIANNIPSGPTLYLLDTNIILDISENRKDSEASQNLMRLVEKGDIDVAVSQKTVDELRKHAENENNRALKIIENLPIFSFHNDRKLQDRLRKMIFPTRDPLRPRDIADIEHVASAIANHAKGFITRDKAVLSKREELSKAFSLEILSPFDFWEDEAPQKLQGVELSVISTEARATISTKATDSVLKKIRNIVSDYKIDKNKFTYLSLAINGSVIAIGAVENRQPKGGRAKDVVIFVLDNVDKIDASTMLDFISSQVKPMSVVNLSLHGWSEQLVIVLQERGYLKSDTGGYRKIYAHSVIGKQNWQTMKTDIRRIGQISLPEQPPDYKKYNQSISLGQELAIPLRALEDFLSAIFILPGRDGVIVPIKEHYADSFFAHSLQGSLFSRPEAHISTHKIYFGTPRAATRLTTGKLLFFYQSRSRTGSGQVIALARIVRSHIASKSKIEQDSKRRGVLDATGFQGVTKTDMVLETVFTHSTVFPKPVTLETLRRINCVDPANFITAFSINHQQVCTLLKEGGILCPSKRKMS